MKVSPGSEVLGVQIVTGPGQPLHGVAAVSCGCAAAEFWLFGAILLVLVNRLLGNFCILNSNSWRQKDCHESMAEN